MNKDQYIKTKAVIGYCYDHLDKMWAARVVGILLGCDWRDAKEHSDIFLNETEEPSASWREDRLENALKKYADPDFWANFKKDELHEANILTPPEDRESFGYQKDPYSKNILQITGGKIAREALND